jgi:hypothetical protein
MNFLKNLNFDKQKIEKIWKFDCLLNVSDSTVYYKKIEDEINCIIKIKRPFMKVMLLNEVVKYLLFNPNFDIIRFFDSLIFFQYPYYSINITFHDSHAIKVAPHRQM